jgi:hypothetical protein
MKRLIATIFLSMLFAGISFAAPPEVSETEKDQPEVENPQEPEDLQTIEDILEGMEVPEGQDRQAIADLEKKLAKLESKYKGIERVLKGINEGYEIEELILSGDSVYIRLSDDSSFTFYQTDAAAVDNAGSPQNDIVGFGKTITVREDELIEGDVVSAFGDVVVHGTVEGGVIAFSGDIYISSTGNVENGVLAISGKVKREPGSRVGSVIWGSHYDQTGIIDHNKSIYRYMALVFLIIFLIWIILTATSASLLKSNVRMVIQYIDENGILKSLLMGYLAYCLAFLIFLGLIITILGIPLALLGIPLAVLAGAVLSSTAINNMIGARILASDRHSFKAFLYGSLILGTVPGLFFIVQLITGSLVFMVFSWIVIGIFIFIILPVGLGAVFSTRFGTRLKKKPQKDSPVQSQA